VESIFIRFDDIVIWSADWLMTDTTSPRDTLDVIALAFCVIREERLESPFCRAVTSEEI
jgi:hypothetical protein